MRSLKTKDGKRLDLSIIHKELDELYENKIQILSDKEKVEYFETVKILKKYRTYYLILKIALLFVLACVFVFWLDMQDNANLVLNYHGKVIYLFSNNLDTIDTYNLTLYFNFIFWISIIIFEHFFDQYLENIFTVNFVKKMNEDVVLKEFTILNHCNKIIPKNSDNFKWTDRFFD